MRRRRFILKAGGTLAAAGTVGAVNAPYVIAQPKVQWRMSTAFPASFDVIQGSAERLGKIVEEMSGCRFRIEVSPGGQIMPPFECFDATSKGTDIQAFLGSPQYWGPKEPAVQVYGFTEHHAKNAIALHRLRTEFKDKVEVLPCPAPVLRALRKLAGEVVREESEKSPLARKVHASFAKFQALIGPWDRVAEGAYHRFVAG